MNIEKVDVKSLVLNPNNPRIIKDDKFKKLVKSIKEFPEMLEVRPIVVDDDMVVLGGNMRLKACISAGLEEVYIIKFKDLSEDKKKEFIVKDNVGYGEWDFELLLEDWDKDDLIEWGLDVPKDKKNKNILPDNIIALFINLKDEEKQKELYDKLVELGYKEKDIKLMSFAVDEEKNEIIIDTSKIERFNNILRFNIDRINEPEITYNVKYILDKFDMKSVNKQSFNGEIDLNFNWNIGLIVGNSGTGKSTIARELFGDNYITEYKYDDRAIVDNFGDVDINDIINTLTGVGLSSTTTWLKPYKVLSGGEKMRCDLGRALLSNDELIVFDEFTSVVDRNIAKIGSFVVQKNIRKNNKKFIAVGCHFDVEDWLMPDWVFNTNDMTFYVNEEIKKKKRPSIEFEIRECRGKEEKELAWRVFRNYHYLDHNLNYAARVFIGYVNGDMAVFCAVLPQPGVIPNMFRISRTVVLPDFQGLGLSDRLNCYVGELYYKNKKSRLSIVTTHPGLIRSYLKSNRWKLTNFDKSVKLDGNFDKNELSNRLKASFLYIPINYDFNIWELN